MAIGTDELDRQSPVLLTRSVFTTEIRVAVAPSKDLGLRSCSTMALYAHALDHFISLPVSKEMVSHVANKASQVIRCNDTQITVKPFELMTQGYLHPNSRERQVTGHTIPIPTTEQFIASLVDRSHVNVPTLMTSLVYIHRVKSRLGPLATGIRCVVHRIFLASLILAAKYLNDSSPRNKHWSSCSRVHGFDDFGFSVAEVNLMEWQLLTILDWDLRVYERDLYEHLQPFLSPIVAQLLDVDSSIEKVETSQARTSRFTNAVDHRRSCYAKDCDSVRPGRYLDCSSIYRTLDGSVSAAGRSLHQTSGSPCTHVRHDMRLSGVPETLKTRLAVSPQEVIAKNAPPATNRTGNKKKRIISKAKSTRLQALEKDRPMRRQDL